MSNLGARDFAGILEPFNKVCVLCMVYSVCTTCYMFNSACIMLWTTLSCGIDISFVYFEQLYWMTQRGDFVGEMESLISTKKPLNYVLQMILVNRESRRERNKEVQKGERKRERERTRARENKRERNREPQREQGWGGYIIH